MALFSKMFFFIFLCTSCTGIIYQPDKKVHYNPNYFDLNIDPFSIKSMDGTKLSAWKIYSKTKPKNLILFFHGNGQNLTSHFVNLQWLTQYDSDVIIFDYRGYGFSDGSPNPKGVSEDGLAFLNYAYEDYKKWGYSKFVIYTQSLGGAIALKSLEEFKHRDEINLLVLDSTFLSPRDVAKEKTNKLLSLLVSNNYTANPKLSHITMPVVSIHSKEDPVINYDLGVQLAHSVPSTKKEFWSLDIPGHGDVFFIEGRKYREKFLKFLDN